MAGKKKTIRLPIRPSFRFWLNRGSKKYGEIDAHLIHAIRELKATRQFTATVRDGLHLIISLREGSTAVLEALFPTLVKRLVESHHSRELELLRNELVQLQARLEVTAVAAPPAGPRPLASAAVQLPVFPEADDSDTLVLHRSTSTDASANFLNAMLGLQQ